MANLSRRLPSLILALTACAAASRIALAVDRERYDWLYREYLGCADRGAIRPDPHTQPFVERLRQRGNPFWNDGIYGRLDSIRAPYTHVTDNDGVLDVPGGPPQDQNCDLLNTVMTDGARAGLRNYLIYARRVPQRILDKFGEASYLQADNCSENHHPLAFPTRPSQSDIRSSLVQASPCTRSSWGIVQSFLGNVYISNEYIRDPQYCVEGARVLSEIVEREWEDMALALMSDSDLQNCSVPDPLPTQPNQLRQVWVEANDALVLYARLEEVRCMRRRPAPMCTGPNSTVGPAEALRSARHGRLETIVGFFTSIPTQVASACFDVFFNPSAQNPRDDVRHGLECGAAVSIEAFTQGLHVVRVPGAAAAEELGASGQGVRQGGVGLPTEGTLSEGAGGQATAASAAHPTPPSAAHPTPPSAAGAPEASAHGPSVGRGPEGGAVAGQNQPRLPEGGTNAASAASNAASARMQEMLLAEQLERLTPEQFRARYGRFLSQQQLERAVAANGSNRRAILTANGVTDAQINHGLQVAEAPPSEPPSGGGAAAAGLAGRPPRRQLVAVDTNVWSDLFVRHNDTPAARALQRLLDDPNAQLQIGRQQIDELLNNPAFRVQDRSRMWETLGRLQDQGKLILAGTSRMTPTMLTQYQRLIPLLVAARVSEEDARVLADALVRRLQLLSRDDRFTNAIRGALNNPDVARYLRGEGLPNTLDRISYRP
jgi:hypothetical protein